MENKLPCSAHAQEPECEYCEDRGYNIWSCCGIDITHEVETVNNDLCPKCKEHCGDEKVACECLQFKTK